MIGDAGRFLLLHFVLLVAICEWLNSKLVFELLCVTCKGSLTAAEIAGLENVHVLNLLAPLAFSFFFVVVSFVLVMLCCNCTFTVKARVTVTALFQSLQKFCFVLVSSNVFWLHFFQCISIVAGPGIIELLRSKEIVYALACFAPHLTSI